MKVWLCADNSWELRHAGYHWVRLTAMDVLAKVHSYGGRFVKYYITDHRADLIPTAQFRDYLSDGWCTDRKLD